LILSKMLSLSALILINFEAIKPPIIAIIVAEHPAIE